MEAFVGSSRTRRTTFQMPTPFYTVAKSGMIWTITYAGGK
jgi:hypothetical protein